MNTTQEMEIQDYTYLSGHMAARPLKFVKDGNNYGWLCDKFVDPGRDLREQGCWRCDEMPFANRV
jgi:hypothetical protein